MGLEPYKRGSKEISSPVHHVRTQEDTVRSPQSETQKRACMLTMLAL